VNSMRSRKFFAPHNVRRNRIFLIGGAVCSLAVIWVVYQLGQIRAGHNEFQAQQRYAELAAQAAQADEQNNELRGKIALLETSRKIDDEAYSQVEQRMVGLQDEILAQREELAFYRGIVADQQAGLRVQDLELLAGNDELTFSLRLVLVQAMQASQRISGSVEFQVEGVRDGVPLTLGLAELGIIVGQRKLLSEFSFRYFQNFAADIVLPYGFAPQRVIVKLTPKGNRTEPVEKSFDWVVRSG